MLEDSIIPDVRVPIRLPLAFHAGGLRASMPLNWVTAVVAAINGLYMTVMIFTGIDRAGQYTWTLLLMVQVSFLLFLIRRTIVFAESGIELHVGLPGLWRRRTISFSDVQGLSIDRESALTDRWTLSLHLKNGAKIPLAQGKDRGPLETRAQELTGILPISLAGSAQAHGGATK